MSEIKVAFQGMLGAFSHMAALEVFPETHPSLFIGLNDFPDVFEYVTAGKADYAVIPIENSLIGSIYETYDLLMKHDLFIVGERYTKIEHCLLTVPRPETNVQHVLGNLKKAFSHTKALQQCASFFKKHPWIEPVVHMDTAGAAAEIAALNEPAWAAIASAKAGEIYHLRVLLNQIQDEPNNFTRFVILSKIQSEKRGMDKCSILFDLPHVPGSLSNVLNFFATKGINLTKIESRPLVKRPFECQFFIDFEFEGKSPPIETFLGELKSKVLFMKLLGIYKKGNPFS